MKNLLTATLACLAAVGLTACSPTSTESADASDVRNVVMTTFYPTMYFAERIAGGLVPVECPLPADEDPIFWRPEPEVIGSYQRARLIVINGAEFEKWAITAPLPRSRLVNTASGFTDRFITMEATTHSHGPAGEHSHEGTDGHTWVDPLNAIEQVRAMQAGMAEAFPDHAAAFETNADALVADLRELHDRVAALSDAIEGVALLASHPAYNYLAERHGWQIENLDLDPESPLSDETLSEIRGAIPGDNTSPVILLWESDPLAATRESLAAEGITSVLFSPAETAPDEGDYLNVMNANIDRLAEALTAQ